MPGLTAVHIDTRQKIIEAALLVASKEGFEGATTQQISRRAGVSEGIIYHYFRNKEDLCVNLIKEKAAEFRGKLLKEITECPSAKEKLIRLIDYHVDYFAGETGLFNILFGRAGGSPIMLSQALKNAILPYAEMIEEIIEEGIKKGELRCTDPKITALNLIGMLQLSLISIVLQTVHFSVKDARDNIKKVFFGGILK